MVSIGRYRGFHLYRDPFTRVIEVRSEHSVVAEITSDDETTDAQRLVEAKQFIDDMIDGGLKVVS